MKLPFTPPAAPKTSDLTLRFEGAFADGSAPKFSGKNVEIVLNLTGDDANIKDATVTIDGENSDTFVIKEILASPSPDGPTEVIMVNDSGTVLRLSSSQDERTFGFLNKDGSSLGSGTITSTKVNCAPIPAIAVGMPLTTRGRPAGANSESGPKPAQ